MVWLESPTNPLMKIVDIAAAAEIAHQHAGIIVVVDNTFMTPYFQVQGDLNLLLLLELCYLMFVLLFEFCGFKRPLDLGADVVIHSLTKYMNGTPLLTVSYLLHIQFCELKLQLKA
jgi:cystathionine gamma-lyase